jgi:hypothetical protein
VPPAAKEYAVHHAPERPSLAAGWDDPSWAQAPPLEIAEFRPESSDHRPRTRARLLHARGGLLGIFRVEDRYVRCRHRRFQDPVYEDSCVELFLQPKPGRGYLNFEMSGGGVLLASHVTDHRRTAQGFAAFERLRPEEGRLIEVRSTLPPVVEPEIETRLAWELSFFIPFVVIEAHVGAIGPVAGQEWRANLYKCGDRTSHPHWAAWSAVDALNFHLPRCFGVLRFEAPAAGRRGDGEAAGGRVSGPS